MGVFIKLGEIEKQSLSYSLKVKALMRISWMDLGVLTNHHNSFTWDIRQSNWCAHRKLQPVLSAYPGIFRRGLCAFAETPSEQHQKKTK